MTHAAREEEQNGTDQDDAPKRHQRRRGMVERLAISRGQSEVPVATDTVQR